MTPACDGCQASHDELRVFRMRRAEWAHEVREVAQILRLHNIDMSPATLERVLDRLAVLGDRIHPL